MNKWEYAVENSEFESLKNYRIYPTNSAEGIAVVFKEDNARLIAAVPDLLEADTAMIEYISGQWLKDWDNRPNCLRMGEDAIAKTKEG